jgi:hypothetical protein
MAPKRSSSFVIVGDPSGCVGYVERWQRVKHCTEDRIATDQSLPSLVKESRRLQLFIV